jgi:hypothetical protein
MRQRRLGHLLIVVEQLCQQPPLKIRKILNLEARRRRHQWEIGTLLVGRDPVACDAVGLALLVEGLSQRGLPRQMRSGRGVTTISLAACASTCATLASCASTM